MNTAEIEKKFRILLEDVLQLVAIDIFVFCHDFLANGAGLTRAEVVVGRGETIEFEPISVRAEVERDHEAVRANLLVRKIGAKVA